MEMIMLREQCMHQKPVTLQPGDLAHIVTSQRKAGMGYTQHGTGPGGLDG